MDNLEKTDESVEVITIISEDADAKNSKTEDIITIELESAGAEGVAATTTVVSSSRRRRHRPYGFEVNPIRRMRHHNRLMHILLQTINELSARVGKQAALVVASVGKSNSCQVFGAKPLRDIIRNSENLIVDSLEKAIANQAPVARHSAYLAPLPPLVFEGIPTPVSKMSQSQLRSFIPLILKFSLGRGKPGWGVKATRPSWWPRDVPWSNVRTDVRSEAQKKRISWTRALRQVVVNCYNFHKRQDLLPAFSPEDLKINSTVVAVVSPDIEIIESEEEEEIDVESVSQDVSQEVANDDTVPSENLVGENKIEYYVDNSIESEKDMDDAVHTEDLVDMDDAVQTEENMDEAVQTKENMGDAVETKDLVYEKHIGKDLYDAVQCEDLAEENMDDVVHTEDLVDMDDAVQTEENMDEAVQTKENMVDDTVPSENLVGENKIEYYVDNSIESEKDMDDAVHTEDLVDMDDAVQTEENMDEAVQTKENMGDAVETKDLVYEKHIGKDLYDAVQCEDLAEENMDDVVHTEDLVDMDDAVQTEQNMDEAVQTKENMGDAVQTKDLVYEKHIGKDLYEAVQCEDLAEENMDNAVQTEENMYDAVQTEDMTEQRNIVAGIDNAQQCKYLAEENQIDYYVEDAKQCKYLAKENQMDYYVHDAVQTGDMAEQRTILSVIENAQQYKYLAGENQIEYYVVDADQCKYLANENQMDYYVHDAIQTGDMAEQRTVVPVIENAQQYKYLAGENQIDYFVEDAEQCNYLAKENQMDYYVHDAVQTGDMAEQRTIVPVIENAQQYEYLAGENQIDYYVDDEIQPEENMDDADYYVDDAIQSVENMDDTVQTGAMAQLMNVVSELDNAEKCKYPAKENLIDCYVNDAVQCKENMDDAVQTGDIVPVMDNSEQCKYLAEENHIDYYEDDTGDSEENMDDEVQTEDMEEQRNIVAGVDNRKQCKYLTGGYQTDYYEDNAGQEYQNRLGYNIDGVLQSNEALTTESNYSDETVEMEFRYEQNLTESSQSRYQLCDSTQSEETIGRVNSFQSDMSSGVFPVYNDCLLCDFGGDSNSTTYHDQPAHDPMEDDTVELPEVEGDEDAGPVSSFSPAGRFFLRPITAEDEELEEISFVLELQHGEEYSLEDLQSKIREE